MGRGAYASARRAGTETAGVECPTCHAWQPPEAVRRAADGTLRTECVTCDRARSTAAQKARRAARVRERRAASKPVMMALPDGHKRCCGCSAVKPHAEFYARNKGREAGRLTSHCKECVAARTRARWVQRKAEKVAGKRQAIDWNDPPAEMSCTGCGETYPTETFPQSGSRSPNGNVVYKRKCRACRNAEQNERNKRENPTTRQQINEAKALAAGLWTIRPTSHTSALAEGNIAAALYAQALRAMALSPPVPVWEREEWFA